MIAANHQQQSRANSRIGNHEEMNGVSTPSNVNGTSVHPAPQDPTDQQEAPHHDDSSKTARMAGVMVKSVGSENPGNTVEDHAIDDESDDEDEDEEEEEEEEEDDDIVGNGSNGGARVVDTGSSGMGSMGGSIGVGEHEIRETTARGMGVMELSGGGGAGGGMGGYWRHSRSSSPRMPPPEQPEQRPKSRHDSLSNTTTRYNNLGYWRARRVTFYKNGDPYFPGVEFR